MIISALRGFCRTVDFIVMVAGKAAAFLMPILAAVVVFEVFSRYILNSPTIWAYDLSLFMFGYIAALGGAYAHQKRAHINVDILYLRVTPGTKAIFNLVAYAMGIFFLCVVLSASYEKLGEALQFNYRRQSEWAPPMFHFWAMMIIASSLFLAQLFRDAISSCYFLMTGRPILSGDGEMSHGN